MPTRESLSAALRGWLSGTLGGPADSAKLLLQGAPVIPASANLSPAEQSAFGVEDLESLKDQAVASLPFGSDWFSEKLSPVLPGNSPLAEFAGGMISPSPPSSKILAGSRAAKAPKEALASIENAYREFLQNNPEALRAAQNLPRFGAIPDPGEPFHKQGWQSFGAGASPEGYPLWEIPSEPGMLNRTALARLGNPNLRAEHVWDNEELWRNYPGLAKLPVKPEQRSGAYGGFWSQGGEPVMLTLKQDLAPYDSIRTLEHELQHGVDAVEGRNFGADPSWFVSPAERDALALAEQFPDDEVLKRLGDQINSRLFQTYLRSFSEARARNAEGRLMLPWQEKRLVSPAETNPANAPWPLQHGIPHPSQR